MNKTETHRDPQVIAWELEDSECELAGLQDREWELEDEIHDLKKELRASREFNGTGQLSVDELTKARAAEIHRYETITGRDYIGKTTCELIVTSSVTGPMIIENSWVEKLLNIPKEHASLAEELES